MISLNMSLMRPSRRRGVPQPTWSISAGDRAATVVSAPTPAGPWELAPGDRSATISRYPEYS